MESMWNERYGKSDEFAYGLEPNDYLRDSANRFLQEKNALKILCLADGEGRNGVYLAGLGHDVTSMDISEAGINKAKKLSKERNVSIEAVVADLEEYDLGNDKWDVIVSVFVHTPPHVRKKVHSSIAKALRPDGMFILEAYTPNQIGRGTGGPPVPSMMMTLDILKDELKGMEFTEGQEVVRNVLEGEFHTGEAAVVQVVANLEVDN